MTVKVYHSDQAGAPALSGTVGTLINVLDAVLVNGYNQVNVSSMTRSGSTVTVTCATPHGYENPSVRWWNRNGVGNVCTIAGADQVEYNGDWPISYVSDTVFTFDIGTATPDTPATGTLTTKRAGGGFSKVFADTNRGVYRSNDPTSRRHFLQVNDIADCPNGQGARYAGWRGYEYMRGIDDGDFPFPRIIDTGPFGHYICKSNALDNYARAWTIITDGKFFFLWLSPTRLWWDFAVDGHSRLFGFGDFKTTVPDAYATLISGGFSGEDNPDRPTDCGLMHPSNNQWGSWGIPGTGWTCIARGYNGQARPVWTAGLIAAIGEYGQPCFGYYGRLPFPNPIDNRYYLTQIKVSDAGAIRGTLPYYQGPSGPVHSHREIIDNVVGLEGRKFMYLRATPVNTSYIGGVYIDITGDSNGKWS
jgi:hypothetical protein